MKVETGGCRGSDLNPLRFANRSVVICDRLQIIVVHGRRSQIHIIADVVVARRSNYHLIAGHIQDSKGAGIIVGMVAQNIVQSHIYYIEVKAVGLHILLVDNALGQRVEADRAVQSHVAQVVTVILIAHEIDIQ